MVTYEIVLDWNDGRSETIAVSETETILDAAESAELGLPFGCLTGACATCVGQLLEGSVHHRRPPRALKAKQFADGYVLLCIAEPRDDCKIAVGADVQGELVKNPWK